MLSLKYINKLSKHYSKMFNTDDRLAGAIMDYDVADKPTALIFVGMPTKDEPYYKLGSIGMSEYRQSSKTPYTEVVMALPKYWRFNTNDNRWDWPINLMKTIVKAPYLLNKPFTYYDSIGISENFETFDNSTDKSAALFVPLTTFDKSYQKLRIGLKNVNFMQIFAVNQFTFKAVDKPNKKELINKLITSKQFDLVVH